MGVLLFAGGCQSGESGQGKFSEEQMAAFGLAENQNLPEPSGGLVLSINKEVVTVDEIISPLMEVLKPMAAGGDFQRFAVQARRLVKQVVMSKTTYILLHQRAKKETADNINKDALDKAAEMEVNKFIASYRGNLPEANKVLEEMGMGWRQFHDYQKKLLLTQYYLLQELGPGESITHSELLDKYNEMKDEHFSQTGQIQFRLIDIAIAKVEVGEASGAASDTPRQAALQLAEELVFRIKEGQDFGELAKRYSNDAPHRVAEGGLWAPVTTGSPLVAPYDVLEIAAWKMEPGEVSGPIEADGHIFIVKLESKREAGYKPFEDAQAEVKVEIQGQRQGAKRGEMVEKLIRQANITEMDQFVDFCVETAYRRSTKTR